MRAYLSYFKLKFISGLQYRQAAYAGIATQFFFGFVYIMIYVAFYQTGGKNLPMELPQLITYVWLNQSFFALISQFYKDSFESMIVTTDGDICSYCFIYVDKETRNNMIFVRTLFFRIQDIILIYYKHQYSC